MDNLYAIEVTMPDKVGYARINIDSDLTWGISAISYGDLYYTDCFISEEAAQRWAKKIMKLDPTYDPKVCKL